MSDDWTHDPDQPLLVHKNSFTMLIDARLLPGYVPTEEERIENERRGREHEAKMRVAVAAFETTRGRWAVLMTDEDQPTVLRELLAMHAPSLLYDWTDREGKPGRRTWVQCEECRDGDDNTMWPCGTARVLAQHYVIETPEWGQWLMVRDVLPG